MIYFRVRIFQGEGSGVYFHEQTHEKGCREAAHDELCSVPANVRWIPLNVASVVHGGCPETGEDCFQHPTGKPYCAHATNLEKKTD